MESIYKFLQKLSELGIWEVFDQMTSSLELIFDKNQWQIFLTRIYEELNLIATQKHLIDESRKIFFFWIYFFLNYLILLFFNNDWKFLTNNSTFKFFFRKKNVNFFFSNNMGVGSFFFTNILFLFLFTRTNIGNALDRFFAPTIGIFFTVLTKNIAKQNYNYPLVEILSSNLRYILFIQLFLDSLEFLNLGSNLAWEIARISWLLITLKQCFEIFSIRKLFLPIYEDFLNFSNQGNEANGFAKLNEKLGTNLNYKSVEIQLLVKNAIRYWHLFFIFGSLFIASRLWMYDVLNNFLILCTVLTGLRLIADSVLEFSLQIENRIVEIMLAQPKWSITFRMTRYINFLLIFSIFNVLLFSSFKILQLLGYDFFEILNLYFFYKIFGVFFSFLLAYEKIQAQFDFYLSPHMENGVLVTASKRNKTVLPLINRLVNAIFFVFAAIFIGSLWEINLSAYFISIGAFSFLIGTSMGTLLKDFACGFFILIEDHFEVGDVVRINDIKGSIESVSPRFVKIREVDGSLHSISYGNMANLVNLSRDYTLMINEYLVKHNEDLDEMEKIFREIADEMLKDPEYGYKIIAPITIYRTKRFNEIGVFMGVNIRTIPDPYKRIMYEYNRRLRVQFNAKGIKIPVQKIEIEKGEKNESNC